MDDLKHYSVLLNESIDLLNIKPNGIYVDCTLGGGGHSEKILEHLTTGHLYAIEQDDYAIKKSQARLQRFNDNLTILKGNFVNIKSLLAEVGINKVDGIVYDLGVSSFQLDDESRGFSYRFDAPLDMRMNQNSSLSAYDVVNNYSYESLKKIFYEYGEEKFSPNIARNIIKYREDKPIKTTFDLVEIIKKSLPAKELRKTGHPAKQVFQAIRIEVNDELNVLKKSLVDASDLLNINGCIAVITFHSLEDKIVKSYFKSLVTLDLPKDLPFIPKDMEIKFELLNHKAIVPSENELNENQRSHSAKLRGIRKIK